jgi:hypothetical protein
MRPGKTRTLELAKVTGRISTWVLLASIAVLTTGCAYVHFQRQYQVTGISSNAQDETVGAFVRGFFSSRGLELKRQYVQTHPARTFHLVFTPPKTPDVDRRRADLLVAINPGNVVSLEQSEWFFTPGTPPNDYVKTISGDLERALRDQFGDAVRVQFVSKSYY